VCDRPATNGVRVVCRVCHSRIEGSGHESVVLDRLLIGEVRARAESGTGRGDADGSERCRYLPPRECEIVV
jgi:hypothetical protein